MNKNTIIGTLLISILLMYIFNNSAQQAKKVAEEKALAEQQAIAEDKVVEVENVKIEEEKIAIDAHDSTAIANRSIASQKQYGDFFKNASGVEQAVVIENNLLKIEFSNKGAQIQKVELKTFKTWDKKELFLVDHSQSLDFTFTTLDNKLIETKDLFYDISKIDDKTVSLKLKISEGQYIEQKYSLVDDSYFVDFDMDFVNLENVLKTEKDFKAIWNFKVLQQEKDLASEKRKTSVYWYQTDDEIKKLSVGRSKEDNLTESKWLAFKDRYFNATFLTGENILGGKVASIIDTKDTSNVALLSANINLKDQDSYEFQLFLGPNDYKLLKSFEDGQENIIELSSSFFVFSWVKHITKWVVLPIFHFLESFGLGYGIIIILLTLIIRMAMMPLTFKSYVSTAKTKLLKPQLDKLKEKYKDDQQKYAAEQMKLYQETGVSMFGGCLPMLLQMPFFLAMFYFFPSSIELRQQSFLWATDLSTYDVLLKLPFTIPLYGSHVSGFTLLMTISSLISAKFNPQMQNQNVQPGMEMMKYMPYIFPFFLMFMFNTWSSGLTLYYFVSNVVTLSQQLFINKFMIDEDKLMKQLEANKKKPKKKGGFRAKMADAYKQQQIIEQEKKKKK